MPDKWNIREDTKLIRSASAWWEYISKGRTPADDRALARSSDSELDEVISRGITSVAITIAEKIDRFKAIKDDHRGLKEKEEARLVELHEARKAQEDALVKMDEAIKKREESEKHWAERERIAKDLSARMQDSLRDLEATAKKECEKASQILHERNALGADLEEARAENQRLAQDAARIVEQFKESEEGNSWVNTEMAPLIRELGEEIMHFVNAKLSAGFSEIDWNEHPHCQAILARKVEEGHAGGDHADKTIEEEVLPSEQTQMVPIPIEQQGSTSGEVSGVEVVVIDPTDVVGTEQAANQVETQHPTDQAASPEQP